MPNSDAPLTRSDALHAAIARTLFTWSLVAVLVALVLALVA